MTNYIMLTVAALLLAVDFAINKVYQSKKGTSPKAGFGFNALLGLFTLLVFYCISGFQLNFTPFSTGLAVLMCSFAVGYNIIGFRILKGSSMAIYTLFLMSGGMLVPYVYGLLFLDEPFLPLRTAGLVLIFVGVVLSNFSKQINKKQIFMCIAVFFLNGFVSVVSKMHQIETVRSTVSAEEFVALTGLVKFVLTGILWLCTKGETAKEPGVKQSTAVLLLIVLSATVSGVSYLLQLFGAAKLDASLLYPFITGGSIVFSTLVGMLFFKEKISTKLIVSIALCFVGTLLFL